MNPQPATHRDAVRALAHRFRTAVTDAWDDDRCEVEAAAFIAELRQRGWSLNVDVDWRRLPPVSTATPEVRAQAMTEIREALRGARHRTTHTTTSTPRPDEGGSDEPAP